MKESDGVPTDGESGVPEPPIGASYSGQAAVDQQVGGKRAPRVKRVTLDEMVGLLNRELRDRDRVDEGRTPMRLVMHSGPAEATSTEVEPEPSEEDENTGTQRTTRRPSGAHVDDVDDLPRPPRVPTIPGTRLLAPTIASDPPGPRVLAQLSTLKSVWPWIALGLLAGLLFGWPLYRHLID